MYSHADIQQMVDRIKSGLQCRVYVFGSYGWGRPNACSDVDLAIVLPDDHAARYPARVAARLSQHGMIPIDVIALKESTLANAKVGSLSYEIRTRGVEL
ncbi:MAG: nucleotidyltransferase domain-containing protein [Burkholderiales bacterium]|nr:nucleotidyltransferase domain-containing protein [Burkholderiales bacterium]